MSKLKGKDTWPETLVRRMVHAIGYRFSCTAKICREARSGMASLGSVFFVHGCFWHRHRGCRRKTSPRTWKDYWAAKFAQIELRDYRLERQLHRSGWHVLVILEFQTLDLALLLSLLQRFQSRPSR